MFTTNPTPYALLFSLSILITYLTVRRAWLRLPVAVIVGIVDNSVCFFLFALARGQGFIEATVIGAILGVVFTIGCVVAAATFRINELENAKKSQRNAAQAEVALGVNTTSNV
jgi:hypothetical protein